MTQILKVLLGFLLIILVAACSVDGGGNGHACIDDYTGALEARESVLVGTWTLTAITSDVAVDITEDNVDNPSQDIFGQYPDCLKDAEYRFGADRAFSFREGQNFSDCSNQLVAEGSWKFTGLAVDLNSSCAVQTIPIRFNEDSSEFTYSGLVTYTNVEGNNVETKTAFVFSVD